MKREQYDEIITTYLTALKGYRFNYDALYMSDEELSDTTELEVEQMCTDVLKDLETLQAAHDLYERYMDLEDYKAARKLLEEYGDIIIEGVKA